MDTIKDGVTSNRDELKSKKDTRLKGYVRRNFRSLGWKTSMLNIGVRVASWFVWSIIACYPLVALGLVGNGFLVVAGFCGWMAGVFVATNEMALITVRNLSLRVERYKSGKKVPCEIYLFKDMKSVRFDKELLTVVMRNGDKVELFKPFNGRKLSELLIERVGNARRYKFTELGVDEVNDFVALGLGK